MTQSLIYDYRWNHDETLLINLLITDPNTNQEVRITHRSNDLYLYESKLIDDADFVEARLLFTLAEANYHALVAFGILPPTQP